MILYNLIRMFLMFGFGIIAMIFCGSYAIVEIFKK
jgi:hypothetical protein